MLPTAKRKKVEAKEDGKKRSSRHKNEKKDRSKSRQSPSPEQEWVESSVLQDQGAEVHHTKDTSASLKREDWMRVPLSSSSSRPSCTAVPIEVLNGSSQEVSFKSNDYLMLYKQMSMCPIELSRLASTLVFLGS